MTIKAGNNVRVMATDLQENALLTRIEGGDLIALDAKYHLRCLTALRNRHRSLMRQRQDCSDNQKEEHKFEARAFVELTTHVENCVEGGQLYFKLSSLREMCEHRLLDPGIGKEINKARFRDQVLKHFPHAQEQSDGKNVILVFEQGMQEILKQALQCDFEEDALILAKAAKLVRGDIFESNGFKFNASFPSECQKDSVPTYLKSLVTMILVGIDLKDQSSDDSQACLTVSQTILFNCKKRTPTVKSRHVLEYEPPLPLYMGLGVHTQTRSKKLITHMYELGLSVSYDRVVEVENQLATAVCENIANNGVVCPAQLRKGLFTVSALDNIDHNPSSTTAKGSFHGTGISLFQFPSKSNMGHFQGGIAMPSPETEKNHHLPGSFTIVPAVALMKANVAVPATPNPIKSFDGHLGTAHMEEKCWLDHSLKVIEMEELNKGEIVAWSAYHASLQDVSDDLQPALTQLLPLFYEKAATASMIKHGMDVQCKATQFLNPGQIPVMAVDAPLYALAKFVRWNWPQTHGEDKCVVMFGGLHIEMAMWKTYGDYLEASGWTTALTEAGIASSGTADSILKASHLTRTRHAHQVSALALSKLQQDAFLGMVTEKPHDDQTKDVWRQDMISKSPTFQYWDTILNMEILGLIFVRAHREQNFPLYVESLKALVPWFFALDHQNYARWIPVHIRDMESLPASIHKEFEEHGHWVVPKTTNRFSSIPIDQAHEQNNDLVKSSGGAVGLTENPSAFKKWMIAGPEQARLLKEFEQEYISQDGNKQQHHEEGLYTQKIFKSKHWLWCTPSVGWPIPS